MSQPLGKVTKDLDRPRGPDVEHGIAVERGWFGRPIVLTLPRTLRCAHCGGGGCDRCGRAGALSLRERDDAPTQVQVTLPELPEEQLEVCVRIPEQGGPSNEPGQGRGHLLLRVRAEPRATEEVALVLAPAESLALERRILMKRSLLVAVGLVIVFLALLQLSGWL